MDLSKTAKSIAYQLGFDLVSVSSANPAEIDGERYCEWREKGYAAELNYMIRDTPRRWVPQDLLPEAKTVITFAVNFFSGDKKMESKKGYGRVARYAWGKDYHEVIRNRLEEWVKIFRETAGPLLKAKILVDSAPLLERAFAAQSGLGFVGKNTVLISRQFGSFIFLSEILLNMELKTDAFDPMTHDSRLMTKPKDPCGSCRQCIADCPTGALTAPRQLDARKCISYWTIENRASIPEELRHAIGDWIFGCDICQEVCPYIGVSKENKWKEFLPESGIGPYLSLSEVLSIKSEDSFRKRFGGTPLLRAKRSGLVRNACIVAGNQKFDEALPLLDELVKCDPDPIVRDHAGWAIRCLSVCGTLGQ